MGVTSLTPWHTTEWSDWMIRDCPGHTHVIIVRSRIRISEFLKEAEGTIVALRHIYREDGRTYTQQRKDFLLLSLLGRTFLCILHQSWKKHLIVCWLRRMQTPIALGFSPFQPHRTLCQVMLSCPQSRWHSKELEYISEDERKDCVARMPSCTRGITAVLSVSAPKYTTRHVTAMGTPLLPVEVRSSSPDFVQLFVIMTVFICSLLSENNTPRLQSNINHFQFLTYQ